MATRPWVTPEDLREYTENPVVRERSDARLAIDITRAEAYVTEYCKHDFSGPEYFVVPENVRIAVLLAAEFYAARAAAEATGASLLKSETNDDYSYTTQDTQSALDNLTIGPLLDPYIQTGPRRGIRMDMHVC